MNIMNKMAFKFVNFLNSRKGASNVEIIVWISVVLFIATILFLFRDAIGTFIENAIGQIELFNVNAPTG